MAITFSPAQPYDPNVAIAYGALQQFEQNQEAERKNYQAVQDAEAKQRASMLEAANLQQRGQHFQQGLQQQTEMEQMREQAQTNNINLSGAWQAQNQEAERKARYTYADEIRRQRLNQGIATLDSDLAAGRIGEREYNEALTFAMNGVDVLEMRRDQAQQRHMDMENKIQTQRSLMLAAQDDAVRRFRAREGPNIKDYPDGSRAMEVSPDHWALTRPPREPATPTPRAPRAPRHNPATDYGHVSAQVERDLATTGTTAEITAWPTLPPEQRQERIRAEAERRIAAARDAEFDQPVDPVDEVAADQVIRFERGMEELRLAMRPDPAVAAMDSILEQRVGQGEGNAQETRDRQAFERIRRRVAHIIAQYPPSGGTNGLAMAPQHVRDQYHSLQQELLQLRSRYIPAATPPRP